MRLCDWPIPRPRNWVGLVNAVQTEGELDALRRSVRRGCPFGDEVWQQNTAKQPGLEFTLRPEATLYIVEVQLLVESCSSRYCQPRTWAALVKYLARFRTSFGERPSNRMIVCSGKGSGSGSTDNS